MDEPGFAHESSVMGIKVISHLFAFINKKTKSSQRHNSVGRWGFRESVNNSFSVLDVETYFERPEI